MIDRENWNVLRKLSPPFGHFGQSSLFRRFFYGHRQSIAEVRVSHEFAAAIPHGKSPLSVFNV